MMEIVKANQERQLKRTDIEKVLLTDSKLSAATVQGYAGQSIQFFKWARDNGVPGYYAVNNAVITNYKRYLVESGYKQRTINYKLKAVRALYRQSVKAGNIDKNPTDGVEYETEGEFTCEFKTLNKNQIKILINELQNNNTERGKQRYGIILTLLSTGLRVSELCKIKFCDIVFDGGITGLSYNEILKRNLLSVAAVNVQRGKGGKSWFVEFSQIALCSILSYRSIANIDGESLFYTVPQNSKQTRTPIDRYDVFHLVKSVGRKILKADIHPHTFRHTYATISLESGANIFDISKNLGHGSLDGTARYLQKRESVINYWNNLIEPGARYEVD